MHKSQSTPLKNALSKCPTGIEGLDQITGGGLPCGRSTLVYGAAGCGKSVLAVEFLVHGTIQFGEPGLLVSFEETAEEIATNVASFGLDLGALAEQRLIAIEYIHIDRNEIEETGEYNLEGLFIRLGSAIDAIGAKRVVLDTIEVLFAGFSNIPILRAELRRLFRWLKEKRVTSLVTGERGEGSLTKSDLEEYVSDCVIALDHRVSEQISTRRLRVVKYRGSPHGCNEYPFLIDERGISVLPLSSVGLDYAVSTERISTGIPKFDEMFTGKGYYRGSSVLITGTAGTGKSSATAHFADATCRRGERCIYFAFEESAPQVIRNMRSIGIDLTPWVDQRLLQIRAARPTHLGLEMHLAHMHKVIDEFAPSAVIVDPISNFIAAGTLVDVKAMLLRLLDFLKLRGITSLLTCLSPLQGLEDTEVGISSLIDTWIQLRDFEIQGERTHGVYVRKSRGMPHSNQVREFVITSRGIDLVDIQLGPDGVLTGSARLAYLSEEKAAAQLRRQEIEHRKRTLERKRAALEAQIDLLRSEFAADEEELSRVVSKERQREQLHLETRAEVLRGRSGQAREARVEAEKNGSPEEQS
jgi:circadian clock protein KaiC